MLLPAIPFDAAMSVPDALARLARYGLWRDGRHPAAIAWIEEHRGRLARRGTQLSFEEAERRLRRDPGRFGVAVRRLWHNQVLWYPRPAEYVLTRCLATTAPDATVLDALGLHETDSPPPVPPPEGGETPRQEGVVLEGACPVAISLIPPAAARATPPRGRPGPGDLGPVRGTGRPREPERIGGPSRGTVDAGAPPAPEVRAWPLLDAPAHVTAGTAFTVVVGLAEEQQAGVTGGEISLPAPTGASSVELTVELIADGVDAPEGWTRPLVVPLADPASARVTFTLVGRPPAAPQPVHCTLIEARYVRGGAVCGTASRPLEIRAVGYAPPAGLPVMGTPWAAQPVVDSSVTMSADGQVADLTIEIAKPDGNSTGGRYVCRIYSPHPITVSHGPHDIDFGHDAKTFARSIVDQVRAYATDPAVDNLLRSYGLAVAEKLPDAVHQALYEVAECTRPDPPAVLVVSAEPYVPWELALLDPPLDASLPPFLGVQTLLGRWLRDSPVGAVAAPAPPRGAPAGAAPAPAVRRVRVRKPPVDPPGTIAVRHMAVMAGVYRLAGGLRPLPEAEREADHLVTQYDAIPLAASSQSLKLLLDAKLEHRFQAIGGPGVVHFAGHGEFDPTNPDSSVMLLSDGKPLSSTFFRSASYGGDRQPLIFLNACMIGIGDELLGDMGGFPGNCLKGGFGGVLGALWEVNDTVAREIAVEFWRRALPPAGQPAEPVAAILRDLRAQYAANAPVPTYLAYVYYGHPRLTLRRQD
jgi:hypothetical protein